MHSFSIVRLSVALLLSNYPFSSDAATHNVTVPATVPDNASKVIDRSFTGFAFEQSSFFDYSFDAQGNPNEFSQNLVSAVLSRTSGTPLLRVGGTSGDHGRYDPSQENSTNFPATEFGPKTKISGDRLVLGPPYFKAFKNWPGAKFEMMVPFYNTTFSHTIAWAREGVEQMGMNNLYALELGNEPTFYPWFSIEEYVTRFKNLQGRLIDAIPSLGDKRIFQAFDTASYSAGDLKTKPTFESGLNAAAPSIKQVAYHYYQNQHGIANWGNFQEYIRHTSTKSNLTNFLPNIKYLEEDHSAIEFAFTEAGYTVGGKGDKEHVIKANNFASALWSLDFQLCAMSMNVSRTNWQQIVRSDLQMWRPVKTSLGGPRVTAHFYSQPFVADFIGKSGKTQVVELDVGMPHNGLYAGYGAYDNGKLARVALLNLELWDQKRSSGDRPSAKFSLSGLKNAGRKVMVHHLNAEKGALAQNGMTYAGLQWTWASKGKQKKVKDDSRILDFVDSKVDIMVNATQAVLLEIQ